MAILLSERKSQPGFDVWRKENSDGFINSGTLGLIGIIAIEDGRWTFRQTQYYRFQKDLQGVYKLLFELNNSAQPQK